MKPKPAHPLFIACVLSLLALLPSPFAQAQGSAQDRYNAGVQLFNQGQFTEALGHFEAVLKARPDFVYARSYAARCKQALADNAGQKGDLEAKVASIVLPEVNFVEAPLGDVLDYFSARAIELSKGKIAVNFIYTGPNELRAETTISLSLRNVPMTEAVKYVAQLSRSRVRYEPHAIVIDPGVTAAPAPAADSVGAQSAPKTFP